MTEPNLKYVNPSSRQFPKKVNPLATIGVAPGFYLTDAGTVAPISQSEVKKVTR